MRSYHVIGVILLALGLLLAFALRRPEAPEEWGTLRRGMTRQEIATLFPKAYSPMLEAKGADFLVREVRNLGMDCRWRLSLHYDDGQRLDHAEIQLLNEVWGPLGLHWSEFPLWEKPH